MTSNDLLAICRYYKGETECPKIGEKPFDRFWHLEENYVRHEYLGRHEYWESEGLNELYSISPLLEPLFKEKGYSREQLGMLACFGVLSYSHNPMGGVDFILDYGK